MQRARESALADRQEKRSESDRIVGRLDDEGYFGLHEKIGALEAQHEDARKRLDRAALRARAWDLLKTTLNECRREATEQVMSPLREAVLPMLTKLFPDADIRFLPDEKTGELTLQPLWRGDRNDAFDALSGGTREQIGVIVRLGLAEVLSSHFNDCLPIVLDDALVNSDPERRDRMLGILDQARKKLQLIILTCDYSHYRNLGLTAGQVTELRRG